MRSQSLRNINVSETVYSGAGEDGELFSKPSIDDDILEILKTDIKCDEETKESLSFCSQIMLLIFFSFNIIFSIISFFETKSKYIARECPDSMLWYYLLSSVVVLNLIYYICLKINTVMDSGNIKYSVPIILLISNSLFSGWGYLCINDQCVVSNFQNTQMWIMCRYNTYIQGIFSITMVIPITTNIHNYCITKKYEISQEDKSKKKSKIRIKPKLMNNVQIEVIEN